MLKKMFTNAVGKKVEKISIQKASKCMIYVYQPKVPKSLREKVSK